MMGKVVYRFKTPVYPGNILYVNLIGKYGCFNDCRFCGRPRSKKEFGKPNIYEKKAGAVLYLPRSPSAKRVLESINREIKDNDREIAIIGLGEPLMYLDKVARIIRKIKARHWIKVRVDTNGLARCVNKNAAKILADAGLDEIRISLNAIIAQEYKVLCRPKFRKAFENLVSFIRECNSLGIKTMVSFIIGFHAEGLPKRTKAEFRKFTASLGIKPANIIFRDYVPPPRQ